MFVETEVRPQGEQRVGKLKLSEAIRIGCRTTRERRDGFWLPYDGGQACVICAAWIGTTGKREPPDFERLSSLLNIGEEFLLKISYRHHHGNESREAIADWLEAQGL